MAHAPGAAFDQVDVPAPHGAGVASVARFGTPGADVVACGNSIATIPIACRAAFDRTAAMAIAVHPETACWFIQRRRLTQCQCMDC